MTMSAQELPINANGTPTMLGQNFTVEEATRLARLRETVGSESAAYLEGGLDERRVAFARWLIATGRLRDDV
jgi:hypothetical protein